MCWDWQQPSSRVIRNVRHRGDTGIIPTVSLLSLEAVTKLWKDTKTEQFLLKNEPCSIWCYSVCCPVKYSPL